VLLTESFSALPNILSLQGSTVEIGNKDENPHELLKRVKQNRGGWMSISK
jgi:hypothetical protein